ERRPEPGLRGLQPGGDRGVARVALQHGYLRPREWRLQGAGAAPCSYPGGYRRDDGAGIWLVVRGAAAAIEHRHALLAALARLQPSHGAKPQPGYGGLARRSRDPPPTDLRPPD